MKITIEKLSAFFFTIAVFGLFLAEYAKAVPSMAMGGLVLCAIIYYFTTNELIRFDKSMLILSGGMLLLYSIQFLTSNDYSYLLERLKIKLPFILLPVGMSILPALSRKTILRICILYIIITTITALFIVVKFLLNYDFYVELIKHSQIVSGPINHIRFSLMSVTAAFLSYYLLYEQKLIAHRFEKRILQFCLFFLIFFVHVYSVRSGILVLYALTFIFGVIYLLKHGTLKKWIVSILLFISAPFLAYITSSSIQSKINATSSDITQFQGNQNNENNSIGKRIISYQVAFVVFAENPILGCGIGDLEQTNIRIFHEQHPDISTVIIPHNQFIYFLMGSGILGLLLFSISFFYPLFYKKNYLNKLLLAHYLLLFISFQIEPMLETQLGVAYSVLFLLIPIQIIRTEHLEVA